MVGRTHGIHAEPTTFGVKLALWALQVRRDVERLRRARDDDRGRQALGRGRHVLQRRSRSSSSYVCERLGLTAGAGDAGARRATGTPSCSTRARRSARASSSSRLEIRHLQRTEVREVEEPFRAGKQKGSSAMPHKRNPVKSEQLCGLARVLRGNLRPGSRTSRCGTSATSRTRRSSASSSPTRACSRTTCS